MIYIYIMNYELKDIIMIFFSILLTRYMRDIRQDLPPISSIF